MSYNPSLTESPRHQLAAILPVRKDISIINWLEQTGRMLPRDVELDKDLGKEDIEITEMLEIDYPSDDLDEKEDMEID